MHIQDSNDYKNGLYYYDTYDKSMNSDFLSYELVFLHEAN